MAINSFSQNEYFVKISPMMQIEIIQEVIKMPELHPRIGRSLSSDVCVHDSSIRQMLHKNDIHKKVTIQKSLLTKRKTGFPIATTHPKIIG